MITGAIALLGIAIVAVLVGSWLHEHPTPTFRCSHCTASFPAWALLAAHELQHRKDTHV